jgi:peptidoglycan/xylan/chitin deacetylase (PgdA/CDA1 family)
VGRATYITTSWDDGHPLDLRVAELLTKYGLSGTFYVPRENDHATMTAGQIRALSQAFEVGAHTLHHVTLTRATPEQARQEIADSRTWIEDVTGASCSMFCPPNGRFSRRHLEAIRAAGYLGVRTVELLSLALPRRASGLALMPTSVQAHPHRWLAYSRNALRWRLGRNFWSVIRYGRARDWEELSRWLVTRAQERGGVFHLWGHSWEVEQQGQWQRLEEVLRLLGQCAATAPTLSNGQLCRAAMATVEALA